MKRIVVVIALLASCFLFLRMECKESLPPYEEPQNVFSLRLSTAFPNPENVYLSLDQQVIMHKRLTFEMDLVNIYEETLADSGQVMMGEISLWWDEDPNVQATLPVKTSDEIGGYLFLYPDYVILNPGDSTRFSVWWKQCIDDQGMFMWEHINHPWYSQDGNYLYENYGPMGFTVQAELQPFLRGPAVYSKPYHLSVTFYTDKEL